MAFQCQLLHVLVKCKIYAKESVKIKANKYIWIGVLTSAAVMGILQILSKKVRKMTKFVINYCSGFSTATGAAGYAAINNRSWGYGCPALAYCDETTPELELNTLTDEVASIQTGW